MNAADFAAQTGRLVYRRLANCGLLPAQQHSTDCQSSAAFGFGCGFTALRPARLCGLPKFWLPLALLSFAFAGGLFAQSPTNATVRFRAMDVFVDAKDQPLAAYQLEFAVTNSNARIVGIEGGEHPAFAQPPFYDPKAMQHERVIIAAFSTEPADKLPHGRTRVATVHIQVIGTREPEYEIKLQTSAGSDGQKLESRAASEERKPQ